MTNDDALSTLAASELTTVTGGFNIGAIGQSLGGLVDSFTGGSGRGAQIGGQIGGLIQSFIGGGGGGGSQPAAAAGAATTGALGEPGGGPETSVSVRVGAAG